MLGNPWSVPVQQRQLAQLCLYCVWWRSPCSVEVGDCYFCQWWVSQSSVSDEVGDVFVPSCLSQVMLPRSNLYGLPKPKLLQRCARWCLQPLSEQLRCSELKMEWCWLWWKRHWLELAVRDERNEQRYQNQSWKGLWGWPMWCGNTWSHANLNS